QAQGAVRLQLAVGAELELDRDERLDLQRSERERRADPTHLVLVEPRTAQSAPPTTRGGEIALRQERALWRGVEQREHFLHVLAQPRARQLLPQLRREPPRVRGAQHFCRRRGLGRRADGDE